jgi:galactokinase
VNQASYNGSFADRAGLSHFLQANGFRPEVADGKAGLWAACAAKLAELAVHPPWRGYYVPGRIEVLGKHTDYAGGSSLIVAAERGFVVLAAAGDDSRAVIADVGRGQMIEFDLHADLSPSQGDWSNYPMTVARRLARNFRGATRGLRMAFASDLPPAAGMSSSSALMVATFFALADANDIWRHPTFPGELHEPLQLAGYLGTVENGQSYGRLEGDRGVGTFGGSEDHTAMLGSHAGHIRQYAYCPVRFEKEIALPPDLTFGVATSGVVAEKTGAAREKYNRASRLAAAVADLWRRHTGRSEPHLAAALHSSPEAAGQLRKLLESAEHEEFASDDLQARLEHFITENEFVIPAAAKALAKGDLGGFGDWVFRSQRAAEYLLGNQIAETSHLAAAARELGALAASAFGAGFGGSVWALVERSRADAFLAAWRADYSAKFPEPAARAEFFATAAGPPLLRLS